MSLLTLEVISAEAQMFLGQVSFVIVPGVEGDFGVYYRHAPLLTQLRPSGILHFRIADEEEVGVFYVFGGFAEVQPSQVTILADTVIRGPEIDAARMKAALELETMLDVDQSDRPVNYYRAMAEINNFYVNNNHLNAYRHFKYKHRTFDH